MNNEDSDIVNIKRTIIDLGTKFTRLTLGDVNEKCKESKDIVLKVINQMIGDNEIYAKYFKSTQMIAFDQQANIDDIDNLMKTYQEWEKYEVERRYNFGLKV
ncbi:MAG: hypothetical protein GF311_17715 [Candidatus Lokiarchaeota archaeon]|nr:hypothetical protein [Candidatus Lokiarchaeota archaeon]